MASVSRMLILSPALAALAAAALPASPAAAQAPRPVVRPATETMDALPALAAAPQHAPPAVMRLTLEEAKQRAVSNSKLLGAAAHNVDSKGYAVRAMRADYFPKVIGTELYMHFNDDLGSVLTVGRKTTRGPLGVRTFTVPGRVLSFAVVNQDTSVASVNAVQPLTDLLKVRQGVKIAQADQGIAQAELEAGTRKIVSGVEQLYWGLLAARRIQAGAQEGMRGAEMLAKTGSLEGRTALVEAQQGLQQVDQQIADLQEQMNGLLDLPLCTTLDLVEPPLPGVPFHCADDVVGLALANSPEIREAQETIAKAEAAVAAGKLDYVPSIAVVGGYSNQTFADYIQPNFSYVGVVGSYTFIDWGKRKNTIRERQQLLAAAHLKLQATQDDVRQKAVKAFREVGETLAALQTAQQLVELRKEAEKAATTPQALRNPAPLLEATKARALAEVDAIKADLAYRQAYVNLMILIGKQ
jgi:outer membrane protein TolC